MVSVLVPIANVQSGLRHNQEKYGAWGSRILTRILYFPARRSFFFLLFEGR
jgi:hypothetical protein